VGSNPTAGGGSARYTYRQAGKIVCVDIGATRERSRKWARTTLRMAGRSLLVLEEMFKDLSI
jgi:hypothetical protein